jgi:hypothetical protein
MAQSFTDPFDAGPFARVQAALGLRRPGARYPPRRAFILVAIAWLPLVLLSALQGVAVGATPRQSLLFDFGIYSKYLVALPALLLGERLHLSRLSVIAHTFATGGYVRREDKPRFDELLASTRQWLTHPGAAIVIVAAAYAGTLSMSGVNYPSGIASWAITVGDNGRTPSWAGWWREVVSQPLLLLCLSVWLWRTLLWARLAWTIAGLDLILVPAHPDLAGGLLFVGRSIPAFAPLAFAIGASLAGSVAESVVFDARPVTDYFMGLGALVVLVLAIAVGPVLRLGIPIRRAQLRGILEYGELASRVGRRFEERWIHDPSVVTADALSSPDFSAATDLYSIAANVNNIRILPIELRGLLGLILATLLPFLPIVVALIPTTAVLSVLAKLML